MRNYFEDLFRSRMYNCAPSPKVPRPAAQEVCGLPLHPAFCRAPEAVNSLTIFQPVVVPIPSPGKGYETLFGCPQEVLVPVSAPSSETSVFQHAVPPSAT
jgi:hypothetical protein